MTTARSRSAPKAFLLALVAVEQASVEDPVRHTRRRIPTHERTGARTHENAAQVSCDSSGRLGATVPLVYIPISARRMLRHGV